MATISTEAAVNQLQQMFTDFDKGTLAAVLQSVKVKTERTLAGEGDSGEANDGSMERAVESLLGNPSSMSGAGGGAGGGGPPGTDHDAALALQLSREWSEDPTTLPPPPTRPVGIPSPYGRPVAGGGGGKEGGRGGGGGAPASGGVGNAQVGAVSERRGRRVALPDDFLRVPGWSTGGEVSSDPQVAADARLAMMLQNQSFQRELQAHPDLAYLGRRSTGWGTSSTARETSQGPGIREQLTAMGNDVRRELDKLAVRWKMKNPGRVENTADHDSSVPLMSSQGDDLDDQAEVVHFTQDNATRRSHVASSGGGGAGSFAADSGGDELLADPRRSKKDR